MATKKKYDEYADVSDVAEELGEISKKLGDAEQGTVLHALNLITANLDGIHIELASIARQLEIANKGSKYAIKERSESAGATEQHSGVEEKRKAD